MTSSPSPIDLDHAATTRLRPEVWEAMQPFLHDRYGNPSGSHRIARDAVRAVDAAREQVGGLVGCRPDEVIFTSGGTESNNHALTGGMPPRKGIPLCGATEHHAVLDPATHLGGTTIAVDSLGRVQPAALRESLESALVDDTIAVVSVMLANNETGVINNVEQLVAQVREFTDDHGLDHIPFHTDAVQAAVWLNLQTTAPSADLISLSGHKLGGPKGVGVLIARNTTVIRPLLLGGGQEHGRRSGTSNVAGIVGFATAFESAVRDQKAVGEHIRELRNTFAAQVQQRLPEAQLTVLTDLEGQAELGGDVAINPNNPVLPNILHLCIPNADSETLLLLLESKGVCASAASSCSSGAQQQSHVLEAMGVDGDYATGALRFSLGWDSTLNDVEQAVAALESAVERVKLFG